jgi:hypothetical protein
MVPEDALMDTPSLPNHSAILSSESVRQHMQLVTSIAATVEI